MITIDHLREVLNEVADRYGRSVARDIIHEVGEAQFLVHVTADKYDRLFHCAKEFLRQQMSGELQRAARRLQSRYQALDNIIGELMSAKDNLREAVDNAANEMTKAADFIKNHPAAADDPELQAMADRLNASAQALGAVDVEQTGSTDTGSTDTGSGTSEQTA